MKRPLIYFISGLFAGFALYMAYDLSKKNRQLEYDDSDNVESTEVIESKNTNIPGVTLFDTPGERFDARLFKVTQVLQNGCALARVEIDMHDTSNMSVWGTEVLFMQSSGTTYYDDQVIRVPKGKSARVIGTFRYAPYTYSDEKTIPVIGFIADK